MTERGRREKEQRITHSWRVDGIMEGNRTLHELDAKAHAVVCVSANADLSAGPLGAPSCDRATRAAAPGLSCRPRRWAAAPARTAAAAAHAGSQGVPWGPGIGSLPLRPQGPRASERHAWTQKKGGPVQRFTPRSAKNTNGATQYSHLGTGFYDNSLLLWTPRPPHL